MDTKPLRDADIQWADFVFLGGMNIQAAQVDDARPKPVINRIHGICNLIDKHLIHRDFRWTITSTKCKSRSLVHHILTGIDGELP